MTLALTAALFSCGEKKDEKSCCEKNCKENYEALANQYAKVTLTTDISHLSDNEVKMLDLLFQAGQLMDDIYWTENLGGDKEEFLNKIQDPNARKYAEINYGPWDQLDNRRIFIPGYGPKPERA